MTEARFNDIEGRTRKIEEIVIKLSHISETIVNDHTQQLKDMHENIEELNTAIYQSCDSKTKEFDEKIDGAVESIHKTMDRYVTWGAAIISGLFMLFVAALAFLNSEHGAIYNQINSVRTEGTANSTNIDNIHHVLDKMDRKLDKLIQGDEQ